MHTYGLREYSLSQSEKVNASAIVIAIVTAKFTSANNEHDVCYTINILPANKLC